MDYTGDTGAGYRHLKRCRCRCRCRLQGVQGCRCRCRCRFESIFCRRCRYRHLPKGAGAGAGAGLNQFMPPVPVPAPTLRCRCRCRLQSHFWCRHRHHGGRPASYPEVPGAGFVTGVVLNHRAVPKPAPSSLVLMLGAGQFQKRKEDTSSHLPNWAPASATPL